MIQEGTATSDDYEAAIDFLRRHKVRCIDAPADVNSGKAQAIFDDIERREHEGACVCTHYLRRKRS
jgi:hypothetical protein